MAEEPSLQASPPPPSPSILSSSTALALRPVGEAGHPVIRLGSAPLATILREPSQGIASLPWALRPSGEARPAIARAPAPGPLPRWGVLIRGPPRLLGADDGAEDVLERARRRRTCSSAPGGVAFFAKGFSGGRLTR